MFNFKKDIIIFKLSLTAIDRENAIPKYIKELQENGFDIIKHDKEYYIKIASLKDIKNLQIYTKSKIRIYLYGDYNTLEIVNIIDWEDEGHNFCLINKEDLNYEKIKGLKKFE
jgi:hypothetical protein